MNDNVSPFLVPKCFIPQISHKWIYRLLCIITICLLCQIVITIAEVVIIKNSYQSNGNS